MLCQFVVQVFRLVLVQLFFAAPCLAELQNVTVDDQSGQLTFNGNWSQAQNIFDAWNSTTSGSFEAGSSVSFQFTGEYSLG